MNVRTLMVLIGLAAATGGCGLFRPDQSCHKPQPYESSKSIARLKVPAGVDAPDTRDALVVPHVDAPEAPRSRSGACLDEPPRYRMICSRSLTAMRGQMPTAAGAAHGAGLALNSSNRGADGSTALTSCTWAPPTGLLRADPRCRSVTTRR